MIRRAVWAVRKRAFGPDRGVLRDQVEAAAPAVKSRRGRARLRTLWLSDLAFGPTHTARVRVDGTIVELGRNGDFPIDWKVFCEIYADAAYVADYKDAAVVDIGAHKGYFGAYALSRGAAMVVSLEPESRNYAALERTARPLRDRWITQRCAVGAEPGTQVLHVDHTSFGHSLVSAKRPTGEEEIVRVQTLEQTIAALPEVAGGVIVKIDAEGSECAILSRPRSLETVDALFVEWHEQAPCSVNELELLVKASGLYRVDAESDQLRFRYPAARAPRRPAHASPRSTRQARSRAGRQPAVQRSPRRTLVLALACAGLVLAGLVGLPEALGDRPYDPCPSCLVRHV